MLNSGSVRMAPHGRSAAGTAMRRLSLETGEINGACDVERVGESALGLLYTSCRGPSHLGHGEAHMPGVQRLVALC